MSVSIPRIRVIAGPTAVGKTAYSLRQAERDTVEIISADSRQVYRQLTTGTAKPAPDELARVRHHFVDELDVGTPYSAGQFACQAYGRIAEIIKRGSEPIVVGGGTLYLHALIHGLSPVVPSNPAVRAAIEAQLAAQGPEQLFGELEKVDPSTAATMDKTKTARVMRALEVFQITGTPLSELHDVKVPPPFQFDVKVLTMERPLLYERINHRTDHMLQSGLLDEVRQLLALGIDRKMPVLRTIGYQEALSHLHGEISHAEMVRLIKRNTRRYAKRQLTWLRRYPEYRWIDATKYLKSGWALASGSSHPNPLAAGQITPV